MGLGWEVCRPGGAAREAPGRYRGRGGSGGGLHGPGLRASGGVAALPPLPPLSRRVAGEGAPSGELGWSGTAVGGSLLWLAIQRFLMKQTVTTIAMPMETLSVPGTSHSLG